MHWAGSDIIRGSRGGQSTETSGLCLSFSLHVPAKVTRGEQGQGTNGGLCSGRVASWQKCAVPGVVGYSDRGVGRQGSLDLDRCKVRGSERLDGSE